jgi:transposase
LTAFEFEADIHEVDARIEAQLAPFAPAAARLLEIPGIGPAAAATIIAEIGVDMSRFPDPGAPGRLGQVRARCQGVGRPP